MFRALILSAFLCATGCAPRPTPIAVSFSELTPDIVSIELSLSLDGRSAASPNQIGSDVGRFFIEINPSAAGLLQLEAKGFAIDGCHIAQGTLTTPIDPEVPVDLTLPIARLAAPGCSINVLNTNPAGGRVVSSPPGIDCGTLCSAPFPPDRLVQLSLVDNDPGTYHFSGWSGGPCAGNEGCTFAGSNRPTEVIANILPVVDWFAAAGTSDRNVWAVGARGSIIHWNGRLWTTPPSGTSADLHAVWINREDDVDAVGQSGTILHFDGTNWRSTIVGTSRLRGLWESPAAKWIAGSGGTLLQNSGSGWTQVASGTTQDLNAIWGSGPDDIWCVGNAGTLLHFDGTSWSPISSGTSQSLYAITGTSAQDIWIAGAGGTLLRRDAYSWRLENSGTQADLHTVFIRPGTDLPNEIWAAGKGGVAISNNGSHWSASSSRRPQNYYSIWGIGPSLLWFFGAGGYWERRDDLVIG